MSFTSAVKEQLLRVNTSRRCCRQTEFFAFLRMSGDISLPGGGQGQPGLLAASGNAAITRRYFKLVKELWGLRAEILVRDSRHFKKNRIYTLRIPPQEGMEQLAGLLRALPDGNIWQQAAGAAAGGLGECCRRAYLRGAFLGGGFISDPKRSYHLEMVCQDQAQLDFLLALTEEYQLNCKPAQRKGRLLLYCKGGEQISDFLNVIGAHSALLELENVRIIKDTSNNVNRIINCDTANTDKTICAAQRQVQAIQQLAAAGRLARLSPALRETAALRLENPELPLQELARLCSRPISKTGLYHRLQKLEKIAAEECF